MRNLLRLLREPVPRGPSARRTPASLYALLIALGLLLSALPLAARAQAASETSVKAAYLFKFLNYVDWPPTAFANDSSPYVIGIANADAMADDLSHQIAGRRVHNRAVAVRKIGATDKPTGLQVLFIGNGAGARQLELQKQVQSQPVLVVTESESAPAPGSMINFTLVDDRVRFTVALGPVNKAGLHINSRMLEVALSVTKEGQQ